jgi:ATP-dependent DNA ligase
LHEIKYDGYRMHARLDCGEVFLLTRTGLDWTENYPAIVTALHTLPARQAYLMASGAPFDRTETSSFSLMQNAHSGRARLVFYAFDLLHLDRVDLMPEPLAARKERLARLLTDLPPAIEYSGHIVGNGAQFHAEACRLGLEGIVSKLLDAAYRPGDRGLWRKTKCVNREEFVVVGWTDRRGRTPPYRRAAAGLLRAGRAAGLCRARRHGLEDAELGRAGESCRRSRPQRCRSTWSARHRVGARLYANFGFLGPA